MNIRPALAVILCGALAGGVQAGPIQYFQIGDAQVKQQTSRAASTATTSGPETVESLDQPEFVRLNDGRMIPYGPGVICSEICVESNVIENPPGLARRWWIAIPIAGAAIAAILLRSGETSIPRPTAVSGKTQEPQPTPTPSSIPNPTPTPSLPPGGNPPQPVPEPGTIALLGAGLALLSRKRVLAVFKRNQK